MNPQEQYPNGFGTEPTAAPTGPNIMQAVETASPDQLDIETTTKGDVQMNIVNAVNANGIVSGRKVVDFIWQRIGVCAMIIAAGCLLAVVATVIIANSYNVNAIQQEAWKNEANNKLSAIYEALHVENQAGAMSVLAQDNLLTGSDIEQISGLLKKKYGETAKIDTTDASLNLVKVNNIYKVASFKIAVGAESKRALLYAKLSDNKWTMAAFNADDEKKPCKDSSEEELAALKGIVKCPEQQEDDEEESE